MLALIDKDEVLITDLYTKQFNNGKVIYDAWMFKHGNFGYSTTVDEGHLLGCKMLPASKLKPYLQHFENAVWANNITEAIELVYFVQMFHTLNAWYVDLNADEDWRMGIDINGPWYIYTKSEAKYKRTEDKLDAMDYGNDVFSIHVNYDVSGFSYWYKRMEEQTNIYVGIYLHKESFEAKYTKQLWDKLISFNRKLNSITNTMMKL